MTTVDPQLVTSPARRGSLLTRLRSYFLFVPLVYFYTGALGALALLASLFSGSERVQHWFAHTWASLILNSTGIRVRVEGAEHIDASQAAIYVANHLSAIDIPVLYARLPVHFRIMAKKALFRYPFLGWYLTRSGQIPIDAGDAHKSLRSLNRASESLRKGTPLVVFPEGGRSATGHLQEFMGGAFYVAIRAQAPVVPMAIVGSYELLPMNSFHSLPGVVELIVGEPISTKGMHLREMDKLASRVREVVAAMYYSRAKIAPMPAKHDERAAKPLLTPEL